MTDHRVASRDEWLKERKALLRDEKAFMRLKDYLAERRRALPWVLLEKNYTFDTDSGEVSLAELFDGRSQLIVYHFMFGPDWEEGCDGCTEVADNFNGIVEYLESRDASLIAVSRTSLEKIAGYRERMGWSFKWVSSARSDFNFDFNVSYRDPGKSKKQWNFRTVEAAVEETHGVSVFLKEDEQIYHTYTSHARAADMLCANMQYLDLLPKGRQDDLWRGKTYRRR